MGSIQRIYHAAIYARLSKEDGGSAGAGKKESNSISNQKSLIRDFVKDKDDIVIVSERADDGYSGSSFERPAFKMMMEDIRRGMVDCVIVKDLSRFGREYIDSGKYIERLFPALGVRFIAVNDHIDSKEDGGRDDITVPFKNLMNDAYCRDISIKIRSHLEVKRRNGEYTGAFTPYGYKKDENDRNRLVPDPYAAGVVKEIFRMKMQGMSQTVIADRLNRQGVLSPMEYKHSIGIRIQDNFRTHRQAEWSSMSVRRVLENEIYAGTLIQGRHSTPNHKIKKLVEKPEEEWIRVEDSHEPVVSRRDFDIVQKLLRMDTRTSPEEDGVYVLAGLAVCGDCGAPMVKRNVPAAGRVYSYYICSRNAAAKKECGPHRIPKDRLENLVLGVLQAHIADVLDMERILGYISTVPFQELEVRELERQKEEKEQEIQRCRELRDMLYEDLKEGIVSKEDYAQLHEGYSDRRKKAEDAVRKIRRQIQDVLAAETDKYEWIRYFKEYRNISSLTRTAAVELIDRVRVFDRKHIEIDFSFDDCFQSVIRQIQSAGYPAGTDEKGQKAAHGKEAV